MDLLSSFVGRVIVKPSSLKGVESALTYMAGLFLRKSRSFVYCWLSLSLASRSSLSFSLSFLRASSFSCCCLRISCCCLVIAS